MSKIFHDEIFDNSPCWHYVRSAQIRSFFWSVFSRIRTDYGEILRISKYLSSVNLGVKLFVQKKTISKKKSLYTSIYRPPEANNLDSFFEELNTFLSKACCKYKNFVLGDFNIDVKLKGKGCQKLEEFCDMFNCLTHLADTKTSVTNQQ